jgi:CheY-like chemotaxis protein
LIARNTERLLRLINQLLDLSKLDERAFTLKYSVTNLTAQARKIFEVFVPLANEHAINFKFDSPGRLDRSIDPDVFEKILYNLLSNAFKFTPDGGAIELSINELASDRVQIKVTDTGYGIDEIHQKSIFERFNQGQHATGAEGTGIGLTYVKKLAELHGGQVDVKSRKQAGSTFTVIIQTSADEQAPSSSDKTENNGARFLPEDRRVYRNVIWEHAPENRPKVLVIDDNEDVREFIYSCLRPAYSILEARDGREGFNMAISSVPEIIVSDIMMPSPNGLELCSLLKTNEITSHIPVILLTARAAEYHKAEGYKNGADSYITKPFAGETLLARIDNLIAARKSLRNFYYRHAFLEKNESSRNPESEFLRKCSLFASTNLDNSELDSAMFCKYMGMSQTQLYRKLLAITGMPISDFIQSYRLKQASLLLQSGKYTVAEIAYQVGFKDPSYFTKCFSKHFGFTPSKYLKGSPVSSPENRKAKTI